MRYICTFCNAYVYDVDKGDQGTGLAPGTKIASIPAGWSCPSCGKSREYLQEVSDEEPKKVVASKGERLSKSEPKDID